MIFIYVTCKNKNQAQKIGHELLKKKLIACANMFPITSLYNWKGKLCKEKETILILKSYNNRFNKIKTEIEKIHPYEIPFIGKLNVEVTNKFNNWSKKEIQ